MKGFLGTLCQRFRPSLEQREKYRIKLYGILLDYYGTYGI